MTTSDEGLTLTIPSGEHFRFERSARSGGRFVFVWTLQPGQRGPGPHLHPHETETFEILSGTLRVWLAGRPRDLEAGETLVVPPGTPHRFLNAGADPVVARVTLDGTLMEDQLVPIAVHLRGRTRPTLRDMVVVLLHLSRSVRAGAIHPQPKAARWTFLAFGMLSRFGVQPLGAVTGWDERVGTRDGAEGRASVAPA